MSIPTREKILALNDDLKAQVLRFAAAASLPNSLELRKLTQRLEDSFEWLECGSADQVFIEQFCAAIRGLSFATMDLRPDRTRGAGWGVEDVLLALVRMLRHHVVRVCDAAHVSARTDMAAEFQRALDQPIPNNVHELTTHKATKL